jgi:peptidoglycan glycosyltransferase
MSHFDRIGGRRRRRRFLRWLILLLVIATVVYGAARWRVGVLIRHGQEAVLAGRLDEGRERLAAAQFYLAAAQFYRLRKGQVMEALGVVELAGGRLETAESRLIQAREAGVSRSALDLDRLALFLADAARYEAVNRLASHRTETGGAPVAPLWRAEAALAGDQLDTAASLLEQVPEGRHPARLARLREILERRRRDQRAYSLFDRRGRPVYGRELGRSQAIIEVPELGGALTGPGGLLASLEERALRGRVNLALDLVYQRAAHAALGRYTGAFVALDPRTGEILALVNHPGEREATSPYRQQYEPGSILKMITLSAALDSGMDLESLFPLNCTGNMTLDGKLFYDWTTHGSVADINEATAVSCNLAFAAMGLEMGQARLDDALHAFGFDRNLARTDLGLELGQLLDMDPSAPRMGLARRSVGLANIVITPLHAALIGATFAGEGSAMQPYLVGSRASLGGDAPYESRAPEPLPTATSSGTAGLISRAMLEVVEAENGTGRRAAVPGLHFAMKTGTAGEREPGLNSVLFGYAPLENPEVAFGFVAEHAGKAELEGARIVRDFLSTVRNEFGQAP